MFVSEDTFHQKLIAAGKDPVRETNDPFYFGLWLTRAPAHEIRPAFTQLLRSPAYAAINPLKRVPALVLDDGTIVDW